MAVEHAIDLSAKQRETVLTLLQRHLPGTAAWVYGSRAKWTSRPHSDLDLVVFATPGQQRAVSDLREAFEESNLPFRVDLFVWDEVPESFRKQMEREHVVLVEEGYSSAKSQTASLDEIAKLTLSSVDKKTKQGEFNVLLCNYMDVYSRRFIRADIPFMAATATKREIERCRLQIEDVVITKDSEKHDDIGVPALIREDVEGLVCGYHLAILRPSKDKLHGPYLYYALQTEEARHQFHSYANGVTRFGLRRDDILRVKIPLPPLPEQRAIAHILGTLDDKIELNRRMNETLEAMARALFKSWFVDFDPVRAKMEGRDTGLPQEIADLFPDRLVESALGEIPEGWTVRTLGELIQLNYGKSLRKDKRVPGDFPVYGSGGSETTHSEPLVRHPTVIVGRKGTIGSVFWAPHGCWPIDTTYFVTSELPMAFVYRLLQHLPLTDMNTDAAVPGLNRSNTYRLEVPYSDIKLVHTFAEYSDRLQSRIDASGREAKLSAYIRDTLLPKLISGEIRVQFGSGRGDT